MAQRHAKPSKPFDALAHLEQLALPKTRRIRKTHVPEPTHRFTTLQSLDVWVSETNKVEVSALNAHVQEELRSQPMASPSLASSLRLLEVYAQYRGRLETLRRAHEIAGEPRDFSIQDEITAEMANTVKRIKEGFGVFE